MPAYTSNPTYTITMLFRRGIYHLMALLYADAPMNNDAEIRPVALEYYEVEVTRALLTIAITARRILAVQGGEIAARDCGEYKSHGSIQRRPLSFKDACSRIIHATAIRPLDMQDIEKPKENEEQLILYNGTITVYDEQLAEVFLGVKKFIDCCITISGQPNH